MSHWYRAHGRVIVSDRAIDGIASAPKGSRADVAIRFDSGDRVDPITDLATRVEWRGELGEHLRYSTATTSRGTAVLQEYSDGHARAEFLIDASGRRVRA